MTNTNFVSFSVSGEYALFSDPITRVGGEKKTYPIPTYEALKGAIASVYWKPTIIWFIDEVRVMKPIRTVTKSVRLKKYAGGTDLAYYTYLADCEYQVRAHFEWNMNRPEMEADRVATKHLEIARRMIRRGGRRDVFLGTRECQACVEPCVFGEGEGAYDNAGAMEFGLMYHGVTYADEAYSEQTKGKMTTNFWQPVMQNGVIRYLRPDQCPVHKLIHPMQIKPFGKKSE